MQESSEVNPPNNIISFEQGLDRENGKDAYHRVAVFTTRVWEHPLIDSSTRNHRAKFSQAAEKIFTQYQIDPHSAILVPVGSTKWIAGRLSDYDVHLFFRSSDTIPARLAEPQLIRRVGNIHVVGEVYDSTSSTIGPYPSNAALALLLSPDDYIYGNLDVAAELRLAAITEIMTHNPNDISTSQQIMDSYFDRNFRQWPNKYQKEDKLTKRGKRFERNLSARARLAKMSNSLYRDAFLKALAGIHPPDLGDYSLGLQYSNGKLAVDRHFVADGIHPSGYSSISNLIRKMRQT